MKRFALLLPLLVVLACKSTEEPEVDRTPPNLPDVDLLRASSPDVDGVVTVTGQAGSVESSAMVIVRESGVSSPASGQGTAAADGSFAVMLTTERLQLLEVVAQDAAGNASHAAVMVVGAPFSVSVEGDASPVAVAGEALAAPLQVRVRDEAGQAAEGISVLLSPSGLTDGAPSAQTDAQGLASWSFDAPTLAVPVAVQASLDAAFLATEATWDLQVGPAAPATLQALSGSEQLAAANTAVADPLTVQMQDAYGNAIAGEPISWAAGAGTLSGALTTTDANGSATAQWTLPGSHGEYQVQVSSSTLPGAEATFVGVASGPPTLDSYAPDPALSGVPLTITGTGFSRALHYNQVTVPTEGGDVILEVTDATPTSLQVVMPLNTTGGDLRLEVCGRAASPTALRIESALGTPIDVTVGFGTTRLETPLGTEEYMLVVYADATSTGHYTIGSGVPTKPVSAVTRSHDQDPHSRLHAWLRSQESQTRRLPLGRPQVGPSKPAQEASFTVLANLSGTQYENVTATLRYQGTNTLIYVDNRVLQSELSDSDVADLGTTYDGLNGSYDVVRNNFGQESDIDSDGQVTILLTATVNGLTPPGSGGFVGGFFYSLDLHAATNSNQREILYGMVPDPTGRWGNVFPVAPTLDVLHGVLPHEQQHLVSYNQHVLQRGGSPEQLWLNEALSHVAEDLCGFQDQNVLRANLFLAAPHQVSMTTGGNALEERGMSYLFTRYVGDHAASGLFERLVQTSQVGVDNVTAASGRQYVDWLRDWTVTLFLAHEPVAPLPYVYTSIDLAADFAAPDESFLSLAAPSATGTLPPSSVRYYRLSGTSNPATELTLSGDVGAVVVRVR